MAEVDPSMGTGSGTPDSAAPSPRPFAPNSQLETVLHAVLAGMPPMQIAERLIREHKVAVIPGTAFGMTNGCYFRVAYGALQKETVAEGIGRLVRGLRAIVCTGA